MTISTTLDPNHRYTASEYNHWGYLTNGWGKMQRWDGRAAALEDAGITGPSREPDSWIPVPAVAAGNTTAGVHTIRYRWLDSKTGYVSQPSEERAITVAGGSEKQTIVIENSVGGGGTESIRLTSETKVDRIVLEATVKDGSKFFKVGEVVDDGTDIVFNISDADLSARFLPWPDKGHEPPPITKYVVSHRERLWCFGQVGHAVGTATFTQSSADVAEGSTAPNWDADTLGDSTAATPKVGNVTWLIQADGSAVVYEVVEFDDSANKIVISTTFAESTATNSAYKLFSRANVIWISTPGYPEGFQVVKFLTGPASELSGSLTAGIGFGPVMVFFSLSGMYRLSWDLGPLVDPQLVAISTKYGALNQRVVVEVEGTIYAMDHSGWHSWSGVFPTHISNAVDDLRDSIDFAQSDAFHAVWIPGLRAIRWFVCYSGDTVPKNYIQLDVDDGNWSTGEHEVGIQDSRLVPTATGLKVYLGDENGHTWLGDTGTADGCIAGESHLTVGLGGTASTIVVDETLGTTNEGLAGCMAHWVEGPADNNTDDGESRLITANTSASIVVASFSEVPPIGDTIWVGSIPSKLKTKAFLAPDGGARHVHRQRYWWIAYEPTSSTRYLLARVYDDYSSTAKTWGNESTRKGLPGVTFPGKDADIATSDWKVDMSQSGGVARIGVGDFRRAVELELEIKEPDAQVEIYQIELEGEEGERTA